MGDFFDIPIVGKIGEAVVGGIFGSKQQTSNERFQRGMTDLSMAFNREMFEKQRLHAVQQADIDRSMAREFAKNGVTWKATDARRAGLDPLAAMGSTTLYSPTGQAISAPSANFDTRGPDNNWLQNMGQDLGTAFSRFMNKRERELQIKGQQLDVEYKEIRNAMANDELLKQQTQAPVDSGIGTGVESVTASQRESTRPGNRGLAHAVPPLHQQFIDKKGRLKTTYSQAASEPAESSPGLTIEETADFVVDRIRSFFKRDPYPSVPPPKGKKWKWVRGLTGGYWQLVGKDRPGKSAFRYKMEDERALTFTKHRKKGLMRKNRAVLRNIEKFRNQTY